jgi:hypothetical protein
MQSGWLSRCAASLLRSWQRLLLTHRLRLRCTFLFLVAERERVVTGGGAYDWRAAIFTLTIQKSCTRSLAAAAWHAVRTRTTSTCVQLETPCSAYGWSHAMSQRQMHVSHFSLRTQPRQSETPVHSMEPRSEPVTDAGVHLLNAPAHFTI